MPMKTPLLYCMYVLNSTFEMFPSETKPQVYEAWDWIKTAQAVQRRISH